MTKKMINLRNGLITQKNTGIKMESDFQFNAPHLFEVINVHTGDVIQTIHFQEGPVKECGINGVANEDLIAMVIERLEEFQNSAFATMDNEMAIIKLQEALMWLRKRTLEREARGVDGTHNV